MEEDQEATKDRPAAASGQPAPDPEADESARPPGLSRLPAVVPAPIYQVIAEILAFTAGVDEACAEGRWIRPRSEAAHQPDGAE